MSGMAPFRSGITACPCRESGDRIVPGTPTMWSAFVSGAPKDILNAQNVHTISVAPNAYRTISAELSAHLRFMSPEYRMASPGTLISPTSVAATICQALWPGSSHDGAGTISRNRAGFKGYLLDSGTRTGSSARLHRRAAGSGTSAHTSVSGFAAPHYSQARRCAGAVLRSVGLNASRPASFG